MRLSILAMVVAILPISAISAPVFQGVASVIDGDTLEIHDKKIRLFGIDAPEKGQNCQLAIGGPWRCGQKAALALSDWIGSASISCEQKDIDRYRRVVAVCYKDGEDLGAWMVRNGWALDYRNYSLDYLDEEAAAQADLKNMWSGSFEAPWDWRHNK